METVFLSYTYNPHPDYKKETNELVKNIKIIAESQELRVVTGVDLAGGALTPEIQQRIIHSDALVALITPWQDSYGNPAAPPFVHDEYTFAQNKGKPAIQLLHTQLNNQGMYTQQEYIPYDPAQAVEGLLKLMRTLVLWKKQLGRSYEIQFLPSELVEKLNHGSIASRCEYQLLINRKPSEWRVIDIWPEPGRLVTYIPNIPDDAKLNLKISFADEQWLSNFCSPQNHSIKLEKLT
ncbi:MAG: hypothetical protein GQ582_09695 [Methyloprofundus sp.]|nr:hypothetical protein [Methyloprofundus sp.]